MKTAEEILSEIFRRNQGSLSDIYWKTTVLEAMEAYASQKWIPVSERLPEEGVLVTMGHCDDEWVCAGYFSVEFGCSWYNQSESPLDSVPCYPTHWQPLPPKPKQ